MPVNALNDIKKSLVDPENHLKNWGSEDPCNKNWTAVICYNTTLSDGYLHVQELYALTSQFGLKYWSVPCRVYQEHNSVRSLFDLD
jgi:Leucine rich repeat N-terminal domain